ncbi:MAG: hypothetical protein LBU60_00195 [Clostridiales bacterium]|jgi:hypothetical protein|nr:hypothetical protein [Clostridiales bacterium]
MGKTFKTYKSIAMLLCLMLVLSLVFVACAKKKSEEDIVVPTGIVFQDDIAFDVVEGGSLRFVPTIVPANAPGTVRMSVSSDVASIGGTDGHTLIVSNDAIDRGVTEIVVNAFVPDSTVSVPVTVTIRPKPKLDTRQIVRLAAGSHYKLDLTIDGEQSSEEDIVWMVSDNNYITVDQYTGLITANQNANPTISPLTVTTSAILENVTREVNTQVYVEQTTRANNFVTQHKGLLSWDKNKIDKLDGPNASEPSLQILTILLKEVVQSSFDAEKVRTEELQYYGLGDQETIHNDFDELQNYIVDNLYTQVFSPEFRNFLNNSDILNKVQSVVDALDKDSSASLMSRVISSFTQDIGQVELMDLIEGFNAILGDQNTIVNQLKDSVNSLKNLNKFDKFYFDSEFAVLDVKLKDVKHHIDRILPFRDFYFKSPYLYYSGYVTLNYNDLYAQLEGLPNMPSLPGEKPWFEEVVDIFAALNKLTGVLVDSIRSTNQTIVDFKNSVNVNDSLCTFEIEFIDNVREDMLSKYNEVKKQHDYLISEIAGDFPPLEPFE